jgi:hypothetical protein
MTDEPTQTLDSFESRLLLALRAEVGRPSRRPSPSPVRRQRPMWARSSLVAGAAATAVLTGVVVLQQGGDTPSPDAPPSASVHLAAYSVEKDGAGDVEVLLRRLEDTEGLERALAAKGVRADVAYDGADGGVVVEKGDEPAGSPATAKAATQEEGAAPLRCVIEVSHSTEGAVFRVPAALVDSDRVLRIRMGGSLDDDWGVAVSWSGGSDGC